MLEGIPFGKRYFEIGILLRDSLLISSMLINSEAGYNVTDEEFNLLETIHFTFLRKLLEAPMGTPNKMMYLEVGCIPFREIIEKEGSDFFQCKNKWKTSKDWVTTVTKDLIYLEMDHLSFEEIKNMKKTNVKSEKKYLKSYRKSSFLIQK